MDSKGCPMDEIKRLKKVVAGQKGHISLQQKTIERLNAFRKAQDDEIAELREKLEDATNKYADARDKEVKLIKRINAFNSLGCFKRMFKYV